MSIVDPPPDSERRPSQLEQVGAITTSPDVKFNPFSFYLGEAWQTKSIEPLRTWVLVPAEPPDTFANQPLAELAARLRTSDLDVARAVLAEAEELAKEPAARIDSAERRATTLQGTVAVAASVAIAGGGLLLDPSRIDSSTWRAALGALLLAFVLCLVACGVRAVSATSRIFRFEDPDPELVFDRIGNDACDALTNRAAGLLRAWDVANQVGRVKVGLLRSAAWWFRLAIVSLALLAGGIVGYAVSGSHGSTGDKANPTKTSPGHPQKRGG
jgi:hypothetical protein